MEKKLQIEFRSDYKLYKKMIKEDLISSFYYLPQLFMPVAAFAYFFYIFKSRETAGIGFVIFASFLLACALIYAISVFIILPVVFITRSDKIICKILKGSLENSFMTCFSFYDDKLTVMHGEKYSEYFYKDILGYHFTRHFCYIYFGEIHNYLSSEITRTLIFPADNKETLTAFFKAHEIALLTRREIDIHTKNTMKISKENE